jgi:hypothetical protein
MSKYHIKSPTLIGWFQVLAIFSGFSKGIRFSEFQYCLKKENIGHKVYVSTFVDLASVYVMTPHPKSGFVQKELKHTPPLISPLPMGGWCNGAGDGVHRNVKRKLHNLLEELWDELQTVMLPSGRHSSYYTIPLFYIVFCCCWFPSHVFPLYKLGFITFN